MSIFAALSVQILLTKARFSKASGQQSEITSQMKLGEANAERSEPDWHLTSNAQRPIQTRQAIDRGRRISNAFISTTLSFVVTAAAQSERINQEGRILGPAPVETTPTRFNSTQTEARA